jgi:hypothetical protein
MRGRVFTFIALLIGGCSSSGESSTPVDVTGVYSGPVTNGSNTCPGVWNTGASNDAMVTVAQMGAGVSIQVKGAAGLLLQLGFGTNSFSGTVTGNHIDASIIGSVSNTKGGCVYTTNGTLAADLSGDTLTGNILYTPQTNGHADCTTMLVAGCSSQQTFSLARPPKTP